MVKIIGAGLAGTEAAFFLANQGVKVRLYEMRPHKMTDAHQTGDLAELVCSNSLRSDTLNNAVGVLKREMEMFNSLIISAARKTSVPAGSSLAVDRELFSKYITGKIMNHENITLIREEVTQINENEITIVASGPLVSEALSLELKRFFNSDDLHFYDAIAPIIDYRSIDMNVAYVKNRYDKGKASYINCPMTKAEYELFYEGLVNAETVVLKDYEKNVFEGCMPIEVMAKRGKDTLLFGPLKPVGLEREGERRSHAVAQLRQDDMSASMYNIVGFQTNLTWRAQKEVIALIPGLERAEIIRYGVMHKNTYIESPKHLNSSYQSVSYPNIFVAGQISGVEGYAESAASGLSAALSVLSYLKNKRVLTLPVETVMGSLASYISTPNRSFVPMNANFGILPDLGDRHHKKERKELYAKRALASMALFLDEILIPLTKMI